jgi:hypothetical protein
MYMLEHIDRFLLVVNALSEVTDLVMQCSQTGITHSSVDIFLAIDFDDPLKSLHHTYYCKLELSVILVYRRNIHVVNDSFRIRLTKCKVT